MPQADKLVINGNHYKIEEVKDDHLFHCGYSCAFRHRCANPEYQDVLYVKNVDGVEIPCISKPCETIGKLMYGRFATNRHFIFKLIKVCR